MFHQIVGTGQVTRNMKRGHQADGEKDTGERTETGGKKTTEREKSTEGENITRESLPENELFTLLGNETRMGILRALWEDLDVEAHVMGHPEPVSFSELFEGSRTDDSGNFNYHLTQLLEMLVEQKEDGYVLSALGFNVMQNIDIYTAYRTGEIDPVALSDPCPFCGGTLEATYDREILSVHCAECEGLGAGHINLVRCPVSGVDRVDVDYLLEAGMFRMIAQLDGARHGICPACNGRTEVSLELRDEFDAVDSDESIRSDRPGAARCVSRCTACGAGGGGSALEIAFADARVRAFFDARTEGPSEARLWHYRLSFLRSVEENVTSTDPVSVVYTFDLDGERLELLVRENESGLDTCVR